MPYSPGADEVFGETLVSHLGWPAALVGLVRISRNQLELQAATCAARSGCRCIGQGLGPAKEVVSKPPEANDLIHAAGGSHGRQQGKGAPGGWQGYDPAESPVSGGWDAAKAAPADRPVKHLYKPESKQPRRLQAMLSHECLQGKHGR